MNIWNFLSSFFYLDTKKRSIFKRSSRPKSILIEKGNVLKKRSRMKSRSILIDEKNIEETGSTRLESDEEIRSKVKNILVVNRNSLIY